MELLGRSALRRVWKAAGSDPKLHRLVGVVPVLPHYPVLLRLRDLRAKEVLFEHRLVGDNQMVKTSHVRVFRLRAEDVGHEHDRVNADLLRGLFINNFEDPDDHGDVFRELLGGSDEFVVDREGDGDEELLLVEVEFDEVWVELVGGCDDRRVLGEQLDTYEDEAYDRDEAEHHADVPS